ncbi:hypothetical protein ACE38W_14790 [Chitinophaga sp. Hz27]|uniref:hypothetical protein n=1 Tax=Chitinophaga sp. Hz27 TaxID=3347169 RepID=UPI0035D5A6AE
MPKIMFPMVGQTIRIPYNKSLVSMKIQKGVRESEKRVYTMLDQDGNKHKFDADVIDRQYYAKKGKVSDKRGFSARYKGN